MKWIATLLGCMLFILACHRDEPSSVQNEWFLNYPTQFPDPVFPSDNQPNSERIALGKKLFFDPLLSIDSSISCATCHQQNHAFANNDATSNGVFQRPGTRNVPALFNLAYQPAFLREASLPTLEMQILVPIQEHNEFNSNIVDIALKLKEIDWYDSMSRLAYQKPPDAFVITRAIAAFERTLLSANSKYDQVKAGNEQFTALEQKGYQLFANSLNCSKCHPEPFFTNFTAMNNGLYSIYDDPGRWRATGKAEDSGSFKVPSLRNIALTAPYMFDGSLSTLDDVLNHYSAGGKQGPHQNDLIKPFTLNAEDRQALITFLETLSDAIFIQNPHYQPDP
ncbi:MAG: cytochrome-c peroxidase [Bacteroidetes bacterium]|nr:cytochrome-c peroxidase [Bacteroidota bacterium]